MKNNYTLTFMEALSLIMLFMVGDSLVLPLGSEAKEYAWLVILIASLLVIPIQLIYTYILNQFPDKNFYEILQSLFGKYIGNCLVILYIFFLINLWALIVRNQANFIVTLTLYDTPVYIFILCIMGLNLMAIHRGIKVIANVSKLFLVITIIFIFFVALASMPNMTYQEYDTIISDINFTIIGEGVFTLLSYPFTEVVIFILILTRLKCNKIRSAMITSSILSGLLLSLVVMSELLVLGSGMYESSYYPIHSITRKIKIGGLLSRGEIVGLVIVVLGNVIKSSVVLHALWDGVVGLFKIDETSSILHALALFEITWASTITNSTMEILTMATVYPYFEIHMGLTIPVIAFIILLIKKAKANTEIYQK